MNILDKVLSSQTLPSRNISLDTLIGFFMENDENYWLYDPTTKWLVDWKTGDIKSEEQIVMEYDEYETIDLEYLVDEPIYVGDTIIAFCDGRSSRWFGTVLSIARRDADIHIHCTGGRLGTSYKTFLENPVNFTFRGKNVYVLEHA